MVRRALYSVAKRYWRILQLRVVFSFSYIRCSSTTSHIVERVDSIETTLAHLLPEMTANIAGALAVLVLLFLKDWRTGLSMPIAVPPGTLCFASMFSGYNEQFQRAITATKALNDTAVEYISGIAGIKAFGQSKASYEKFLNGLR